MAQRRRYIEPTKTGQHELSFHEGGLHASTHTPADEPIPAEKHAEAARGTLGPKAKKQEAFYRNVLHGRK